MKKKWNLIAAFSALLVLAGCATSSGAPPPLEVRSRPQVDVRNGRIVVAPEILSFFSDEREVLIVWQLPKDSRFRFASKDSIAREDGIVIEGRLAEQVQREGRDSIPLEKQDEIVRCSARNGGLEFACLNRHTRSGIYKYTIRVLDGTRPLPPLDPWVVNN